LLFTLLNISNSTAIQASISDNRFLTVRAAQQDFNTTQPVKLSIQIEDGFGGITKSDINIVIDAVNDAPRLLTSPNLPNAFEQQFYEIPFSAIDPESDNFTYQFHNKPDWLEFDSVNLSLQGTPGHSDVGTKEFSVILSDDKGASRTKTLTLLVVNKNDPPVIILPDTITILENSITPIAFIDAFYDSDPDNELVTLTVRITGAQHISTTVDRARFQITIEPFNDFSGEDSFEIKVADVLGANSSKKINVNIVPASKSLGPFDLLNPSNHKTFTQGKIDFVWQKSFEAVSYIFESAQNSLFTQFFNTLSTQDTTISMTPAIGNFYWRVKAMDSKGMLLQSQSTYFINIDNPVSVSEKHDAAIPDNSLILPGYPNPFNSQITFQYSVSHTQHIDITIYNKLGRKVYTLISQEHTPGVYKISWTGQNQQNKIVSSDIYFCQFHSDDNVQTIKILFIK